VPQTSPRLIALLAAALSLCDAPRSLALDDPIFANGFETGTACPWSSTNPALTCPEFETCAEAAGSYWGCFEMPYSASPEPTEESGPGGPLFVQRIDAYFLIDRSGGMMTEVGNLKNGLATVVSSVRCPPLGSGTPGSCIPDLWAGSGAIGYSGTGSSPYLNILDLQPDPSFAALPTTEDPNGCCSEATLLATWSATTGLGTAASGCTLSSSFADRATCDGSPADSAGYPALGYGCLRDSALPAIFVYTDEAPTANLNCPLIATVAASANSIGAKIVGMVGSGADAQTTTDLGLLASGTNAVDGQNGDAPLVFSAADTNAAAATANALLTLRAGIPLEAVTARFVDGDPMDGVDLESIFLDTIEAAGGGADCLTPYPATDTNADTLPDTYTQVPSGVQLCWRVAVKQNVGVAGTSSVQPFEASLEIVAGNVPLESLPLLFLVPVD